MDSNINWDRLDELVGPGEKKKDEPSTLESSAIDWDRLDELTVGSEVPAMGGTSAQQPKIALEKKEEPSVTKSTLWGLAQGATFNFADEILGGIMAATTGIPYEEARDEFRKENISSQEANPITHLLTGMAGGALTGRLIPALGALSSVKGAAVSGALGGAGSAEGVETLPESTFYGTALGVGGYALGKGVGKIFGKKGATEAAKAVPKELDEVGKRASKAAQQVAAKLAPEAEGLGKQILEKSIDEAANHPERVFPGMQVLKERAETGRLLDKLKATYPKNGVVSEARAARIEKLKGKVGLPEDQFNEAVERAEAVSRFKDKLKLASGSRSGAGLSEESLQGLWSAHLLDETIRSKLLALPAELSPRAAQLERLAGNKVKAFILDTQQFGNALGDATGTEIGSLITDIHIAMQRSAETSAAVLAEHAAAVKALPKPKTLLEKVKFIRDAEDLNNTDEVVKGFKNIFKSELNRVNTEKGFKITPVKGKDYVPHIQASKPVIYEQITGALKVPDLKKDVDEAVKYLAKMLKQQPPEQITEGYAKSILRQFTQKSKEGTASLQQKNARALTRGEDVPILLRELDPADLVVNYVNSANRAADLRVPLSRLNAQAEVLAARGLPKAAEFVQNYARSLSGDLGAVQSSWQSGVEAWKKYAVDRSAEGTFSREALKAVPEFFDFLGNSVYSATLGANPVTLVRNAAQNLTMTAPELGAYGYKKALANILKSFQSKDTKALGLAVVHPHFEAVIPEATSGLRKLPVVGKTVKGIDKFQQLLMLGQEYTDKMNRNWTTGIAKDMVSDLLGNVPAAQKALQRLPQTVQVRVQKAVQAGDSQAAFKELAGYLVTKTQLIYGKEGRNQFVRTVGPMLGMFSKWPTTVASELMLTQWSKSPERWKMAQKILFPFVAGIAVNQVLDTKNDPTTKLFLGSSQLGFAPITSVLDTGLPPALKLPAAAAATIKELAETGEGGKSLEELKRTAALFTPVYGNLDTASRRFGWEP